MEDQLIFDTPPFIQKKLLLISNKNNVSRIQEYINSLKSEVNPSYLHIKNIVELLYRLLKFHNEKDFENMTREDILSFLDYFRKSEIKDPQHKWIGTYNLFFQNLLRFFKWVYYPHIEPKKRLKPKMMENIIQLKRSRKN